MFSFAQEEEFQEQVVKEPELHEMTREELQIKVEQLLLDRYMAPFDDWVKDAGYTAAHVYNNHDQRGTDNWFVLIVKAPLHDPIWVKFKINRCWDNETAARASNGVVNFHALRLREGLKSALEQNIIIHLQTEELRNSIVFGEAHIYSILEPNSPVDNLRKNQLVK